MGTIWYNVQSCLKFRVSRLSHGRSIVGGIEIERRSAIGARPTLHFFFVFRFPKTSCLNCLQCLNFCFWLPARYSWFKWVDASPQLRIQDLGTKTRTRPPGDLHTSRSISEVRMLCGYCAHSAHMSRVGPMLYWWGALHMRDIRLANAM
jgi:hypothetical protein